MVVRVRVWNPLILLSVLLLPALVQGEVSPEEKLTIVGGQFQVNTYTTQYQGQPRVAMAADGDFVVIWESNGSQGTDSSYHSIQGQRYSSDGSPLGVEFQVNTYTTDFQRFPEVGSTTDGEFVVVWSSYQSAGPDISSLSIQGHRFASNGSPLGSEFQVNTFGVGRQRYPDLAVEADGDFVVVWCSDGSAGTDSSNYSVQGQRFASDGSPLGGEFQVNTYTTNFQVAPAVETLPDGSFVVVWQSYGSAGTDSSGFSIQGQRFASDGSPLGDEFQVNSYTSAYQTVPKIAAGMDGSFVVVWHSVGSGGTDTSSYSVQGQRYAADGSPLGSEFQVNSYTTEYQAVSAVAVGANNDFVVVWISSGSEGTDSSNLSIQGRLFDSDGLAQGSEFQVNSYTTSIQRNPAVVANSAGDAVVVWPSDGSGGTDTFGFSVQGQRLSFNAIFSDGFESGDTLRWSSTVP